MRLRRLRRICSLGLLLGLAGCGREPDVSDAPVEYASSLTVFDLTLAERKTLSSEALAGDAEAAFRLSQFYSMAGGEGDPNINDAHDRAEERRWLELAAAGGHKVAAFNLAIATAEEDCPKARRMMTLIASDQLDPEGARSARHWLEDSRFDCAGKAP